MVRLHGLFVSAGAVVSHDALDDARRDVFEDDASVEDVVDVRVEDRVRSVVKDVHVGWVKSRLKRN